MRLMQLFFVSLLCSFWSAAAAHEFVLGTAREVRLEGGLTTTWAEFRQERDQHFAWDHCQDVTDGALVRACVNATAIMNRFSDWSDFRHLAVGEHLWQPVEGSSLNPWLRALASGDRVVGDADGLSAELIAEIQAGLTRIALLEETILTEAEAEAIAESVLTEADFLTEADLETALAALRAEIRTAGGSGGLTADAVQDLINNALTTLRADIDALEAADTAFTNRLDGLQSRMSDAEGRLTAVENRLGLEVADPNRPWYLKLLVGLWNFLKENWLPLLLLALLVFFVILMRRKFQNQSKEVEKSFKERDERFTTVDQRIDGFSGQLQTAEALATNASNVAGEAKGEAREALTRANKALDQVKAVREFALAITMPDTVDVPRFIGDAPSQTEIDNLADGESFEIHLRQDDGTEYRTRFTKRVRRLPDGRDGLEVTGIKDQRNLMVADRAHVMGTLARAYHKQKLEVYVVTQSSQMAAE